MTEQELQNFLQSNNDSLIKILIALIKDNTTKKAELDVMFEKYPQMSQEEKEKALHFMIKTIAVDTEARALLNKQFNKH